MVFDRTGQIPDIQQRVDSVHKLFLEHGAFIKSIINYNLSDKIYSEDLFNDIFLYFVAKPVPEDVVNLRGFLYKVVLDRVRDWKRSNARRQAKMRRYAERKAVLKTTFDTTDSQNSIQAQEMLILVEKYLTANESKAIHLHYEHHLEKEKIAEMMGIKSKSVSRYISTGIRKMKDILSSKERD